MNKDTVFVACASNRDFVIPLTVMLKSLLVNFNSKREIVIYILTNDPRYFCRNKALKSLKTERTHIRFVRVNDEPYNKLPIKKGRIALAAYYRLLIPAVLPKELRKVIYLDADLIVNTDIGKLWDLDVEQDHVLAVQEQGENVQYLSSPGGLEIYKDLGLDPGGKQFNTGVMLINLDKWRKESVSQKIIEVLMQYKEKIRWWDQDGMNAILAGKWGELDFRWNLLTQAFRNSSWKYGSIKEKERWGELLNHPYIVHFNTDSKPWHMENEHPYKYLYFKYLKMFMPIRGAIYDGMQILWRRARLFYYYNIYRKRILFSKPVICSNGSEFEVHIVTSENDYLDAIWCLKTFYHYSELRSRLVIHEDGTLKPNSIKTFSKHFINCRIVRREDADKDMEHLLASYEYSRKNRLNKNFYCALKLFDYFHYASTDKLFFLDSDILFFNKPNEIIEYIKENKPFFGSDYQDAYVKPTSELKKIFGIDVLPKVNAGLMFLSKGHCGDRLNFMEHYFKTMENFIKPKDINRHEQTLNAILLSRCGAVRLNENYQILREYITDKTISHHFVNDGLRSRFYTSGLSRLKFKNFLKNYYRDGGRDQQV